MTHQYYYLGIDQSLNATGLWLITLEGGLVDRATVDPEHRKGVERLAFVKNRAQSFLAHGEVKFVAFEGYSYNSVGRVFELGEVGGVLKLLMFEQGINFVVVPPASLKKFAVGNASAEKTAMIEAAKQAGADVADDNQADAFFLAMIARHVHSGEHPTGRARLEVIHQLRQPEAKKPGRRIRRLVKNIL